MMHWWGKYVQKINSKWKPYEKLRWKYYPCPGCILHYEIIGAQRAKQLFNKYNRYPQKAQALYWRSHPGEYKKLIEIINRRKNK